MVQIKDHRNVNCEFSISGGNLVITEVETPANTSSTPLPAGMVEGRAEVDVAKQGDFWHVVLSDGSIIRYTRIAARFFNAPNAVWFNTKG